MKYPSINKTLGAALAMMLGSALMVCSGCASSSMDVRQAMLEAARNTDKEFPDGQKEVLTQFAYLGSVDSKDGVIRVISCRSVLTGMPAPRGEGWLSFFDTRNVLLGRMSVNSQSPPLGCDGSKVYFFGVQQDGESAGNALELNDGVEHRRLVFAERIGSWTPSDTGTALGH